LLYNYVVNILLDRIYNKKILSLQNDINIIASRRETNRFLNDNFKSYIHSQIKNKHHGKILVEIKTPFEEKCLQAVDFLSWAFFRKYQGKDTSYYDVFKKLIVEENPLFP